MKKNMGNTDRIIRIIIALIVLSLYLTNFIEGTIAYILLALSSIFVLTSLVGMCGLYAIFGISTCKVKQEEK